MKIFWFVFILILVFLLLNYGGVTQALLSTGGSQFAGIIGTLQGQGTQLGKPKVAVRPGG
jgi:hypothetical protein